MGRYALTKPFLQCSWEKSRIFPQFPSHLSSLRPVVVHDHVLKDEIYHIPPKKRSQTMGNKTLLPTPAFDAEMDNSFPPPSSSTTTFKGINVDELCTDAMYEINPWLRFHPAKYSIRLYPSYGSVEEKKTLSLSTNGKLIRKEHPYQRLEQYMGQTVRTNRPLYPPQNNIGKPLSIISPLLLTYDVIAPTVHDDDRQGSRTRSTQMRMPGHDQYSTLQVMTDKLKGPTLTPIVETIAMVIPSLSRSLHIPTPGDIHHSHILSPLYNPLTHRLFHVLLLITYQVIPLDEYTSLESLPIPLDSAHVQLRSCPSQVCDHSLLLPLSLCCIRHILSTTPRLSLSDL